MTGRLGYNPDNDRYGLLIMDCWAVEGFHCGQSLEVWDAATEQWIPTQMEMHFVQQGFPRRKNTGWYLYGTDYAGDALEGLRVRVSGGDDEEADSD